MIVRQPVRQKPDAAPVAVMTAPMIRGVMKPPVDVNGFAGKVMRKELHHHPAMPVLL